jgi:hypothetical protein
VSIDNIAGSVEVRGWSRDEVEVDGELGSDVERLELERKGDTVVVRVRAPDGHRWHRDIASDLIVRVPEGSFVNVSGTSIDITVQDVKGALRLNAISGDIEAEGFTSDIDIETFNGDIRNCFGPKPVRTSEYAPGWELRFTEGDGDARVTIHTLNGDLRLCKD